MARDRAGIFPLYVKSYSKIRENGSIKFQLSLYYINWEQKESQKEMAWYLKKKIKHTKS